MAEHLNLYQKARYYDVIFDRDVSREVAFLTAVYQRYHGGEPHAMLDIACGPAYHARAFARAGVRAVGLDLRPEMTTLAAEKDQAAGVTVDLVTADMRDFDLSAPVDLALNAFDGLDALLTNEDIIRHFQAVARSLTPGGLYVVDLTHPRDCSFANYRPFHYAGERDGVRVEIEWAVNQPRFDLASGVAYTEVAVRVEEHGRFLEFKDSAYERLFYPQEITLLADLSGCLAVVGWHGDYLINQPLDHADASLRMIAILQKKEKG